MEQPKAGTLYIVATPIGNLEDISQRMASTLTLVDFIAAEDTRVTLKLLNHLGVKKPMISYFEHNRAQRGEVILNRIQGGESCALCSDAGIPAISDPGEELVAAAHSRGIRVVPIPGPNAALSALCAGGQKTGRFVFEGFLPQNKRQRKQRLSQLGGEKRTMVFYEAPHKLPATLADLQAALGDERPLSICRELTKLHEEIYTTTLGQALERYSAEKPRGEFVLVVAGAEETPCQQCGPTAAQAAQLAGEYMEKEGLSASAAAKKAAAQTGLAKNNIYRLLNENRHEG